MVVVSVYLNIVDVVLENALVYRINKDEGNESLSLLVFRRDEVNVIFLKYSNEGRSSLSLVGIRHIPSDVWYDDTKH